MSYYNGKQVLLAGLKGDSVFIRYSANADGTDFTETWTPGQGFMGVATGQTAPTDKTKYNWLNIDGSTPNLNTVTMDVTFEDGTTATYKLYGEIVT